MTAARKRTIHISCKLLHTVHSVLKQNDVPLEKVYARAPVSLEFVLNEKNRIAWDDFVAVLALAEEAIGGPERLENAVDQVHDLPGNELPRALARYFTRPASLYWAVSKWARMAFPCVTCRYEDLGDGRLRMTMRIDDDQSGSAPFFRMWANGMRTGPATYKLPNSIVDSRISPREAVFTITPPQSRSLLSRGRSLVGSYFAARAAIHELERQNEEMQRYYSRLLEAERKLQEREKRDQLAALSNLAALGEMAGAISHEINNPVMLLYLKTGLLRRKLEGLALDGSAVEGFRQLVDDLEQGAARIAAITRSLLAFAGETHSSVPESVPAREMIDEALKLCGEKLRNAGIAVRLGEPAAAAITLCRRAQATHALLNLLNNAYEALKRTPRADRWIAVDSREVTAGAEGTKRIEISITDNGPGIPAEARAKIFEPFFTTKAFGEGTGLGLSVAKGLVESDGGTLELDPSSAQTRFVIGLPAGSEAHAGLATGSKQAPSPGADAGAREHLA